MSKITNNGLTRSGTGCSIAVTIMATVGVKGLMTEPAPILLGTGNCHSEAYLHDVCLRIVVVVGQSIGSPHTSPTDCISAFVMA